MSTATEQSFSLEEFSRELSQARSGWIVFADDAQGRTLLEVLWLKLGLLHDVLRFAPDFTNLGVRVTAAGHLPGAWSFHVNRSGPTAAAAPDDSGAAELAKVWFGVLLANENQDATRVIGLLARDLASAAGHAQRVDGLVQQVQFAAQNVLWRPGNASYTLPPPAFWRRVIDIGVRLATATAADVPAVVSRAIADTAALATEARQLVFIEPPQMRRELTELLDELIADPQWLRTQSAPSQLAARAVPEPVAPPPDDVDATVIVKRGATPAAPPRAPVTPAREASLDETVLMGKGQPPPGPAARPPPPDDLDATIIVGRGERASSAPSRPPAPPPEDNLDATVIVSKSDGRRPAPPVTPTAPPENMDETIILPKDRKR
jgi:hypothetical protein